MKYKILLVILILCLSFNIAHSKVLKVLCYHTFTNYYCSYIDFSYDELNYHIKLLQEKGWKFVTWDDVKFNRLYPKSVLITIDDGNWSVWGAYWNVFKKYNIKPIIGLYTYRQDYYVLNPITWDKLKVLKQEGCTIVSHGYYHRAINKIDFSYYKQLYIDQEFKLSKKDIKDKLQIDTDIFIFPYGDYTDLAFKALQECGYKYGFILEDENNYNININNNFMIKRIMVTRANWKFIFI